MSGLQGVKGEAGSPGLSGQIGNKTFCGINDYKKQIFLENLNHYNNTHKC